MAKSTIAQQTDRFEAWTFEESEPDGLTAEEHTAWLDRCGAHRRCMEEQGGCDCTCHRCSMRRASFAAARWR